MTGIIVVSILTLWFGASQSLTPVHNFSGGLTMSGRQQVLMIVDSGLTMSGRQQVMMIVDSGLCVPGLNLCQVG